MVATYSTALTDIANELLEKERRRRKCCVTGDVIDLCDERRDLKKSQYITEGRTSSCIRDVSKFGHNAFVFYLLAFFTS